MLGIELSELTTNIVFLSQRLCCCSSGVFFLHILVLFFCNVMFSWYWFCDVMFKGCET